jgi:predicted metal-dependent hydrolase
MSFAESLGTLPKHFAGDGDLIMSHVLAVLSGVFPDGEEYFVRSVRHFRSDITEPNLRRDVAGFIGQEAIHGREHRALNDRLAELGYGTKRIERFTKTGLGIRGRVFTPAANLASTAALEHFTATLAEVILSSEKAREMIGAAEIRDVLLWHALEESEHKAVAFDVFKAVGGSERTRRWTMNMTTVVFLGGMAAQAIISMLGDRATYRRGNLRRSARRLKENPFFTREVWNQLRDYNRPDFHPDDHDTEALLDEWRERLFGTAGTLNDRLVQIA